MNLAQANWELGHTGETLRLLDLYKTDADGSVQSNDVRGFEWYYWARCCQGDHLYSLRLPTRSIRKVVFSPDSQKLAIASDSIVIVCEAATGRELLTLAGGSSVAFRPDGKRLVIGGQIVKVNDASTGKDLVTLKGLSDVMTVAFSPDGKQIVSAELSGTVRLSDAVSGEELLKFGGYAAALSQDGTQLAFVDKGSMKLWNLVSRRETVTFNQPVGIRLIAFSPDGTRLASADHIAVKVWDTATGEHCLTLSLRPGNDGAESLAFTTTPPGKLGRKN